MSRFPRTWSSWCLRHVSGTIQQGQIFPFPLPTWRATHSQIALWNTTTRVCLFGSTSKPEDATVTREPQFEFEKAAAEEQYNELEQFGNTKHEKSLFKHDDEELPSIPDHGFRFYTSPDQLQDRNDPVKRALSTRTASLKEYRLFKRQQIVNKYRTDTYDTGSPRVQGMR